MSEWMPIETAPRGDGHDDGPCLLLWEPVLEWRIGRYWPCYEDTGLPTWRDEEGLGINATHWMPLPEGPSIAALREQGGEVGK